MQGPNARAKVWGAFPSTQPSEALKPFNALVVQDPAIGEIMVARTGYTGEDGFELVVPADNVAAVWEKLDAAGVRPAGLARATRCAGSGHEPVWTGHGYPHFAAGCGPARTVDLQSERDFTGKAALLADGQKAAFAGPVLRDKGGVLRAHQTVVTPAGNGETTSGTFSPTLSLSIAFARLPLGAQPGDSVEVEIRGRKLAATVVKLPFVRNGKALVS